MITPTERYYSRTNDTHGWDYGMDKMLGRIYTVERVGTDYIKFRGRDCFWHPDDIDHPPAFEDQVTMNGKKEIFDVQELIV